MGGGKLYIGSQDDSQLLAAIQKYAKSIGESPAPTCSCQRDHGLHAAASAHAT